jgi:hypothetical protein
LVVQAPSRSAADKAASFKWLEILIMAIETPEIARVLVRGHLRGT